MARGKRLGLVTAGRAALVVAFLTAGTMIIVAPWGALAQGRHSALGHVQRTRHVRVYLVAMGDNGKSGPKIGCGDSAIGVSRRVAPTRRPTAAAMRLLLSFHTRDYGQSGLYNALYNSRLRLQSAWTSHGKATVYLTGRLRLGGECDTPRVAAQLRRTARQYRTVHRTAIYVNGVRLSTALSLK